MFVGMLMSEEALQIERRPSHKMMLSSVMSWLAMHAGFRLALITEECWVRAHAGANRYCAGVVFLRQLTKTVANIACKVEEEGSNVRTPDKNILEWLWFGHVNQGERGTNLFCESLDHRMSRGTSLQQEVLLAGGPCS